MKPILEIKNISKKFRIHHQREPYLSFRDRISGLLKWKKKIPDEEFWALKNVSAEIFPGESVGIIGKNGAGKSTLLKILSKITPPTKGKITARGRVASLLEVGTGFHPELTGRENIFLNGSILGMKRTEINSKFDAIVDFSGVEKFLDTPLKHFSSGMQLRLAFAVAAFLEPEILLIDEVLAVGDAEFQKKCLGKMEEVSKNQGRTVLFVSHNMAAVKTLCKNSILIEAGEIKARGDSQTIISGYLDSGISSGMVSWQGNQKPGNRFIKINSITLKNNSGETVSSIELSQDLLVEINYDIVTEGAQAKFSLVLSDSEGYCLFGSLSNWEENFYGKNLERGTYTSACRIHGNLLNNGRFLISLLGYSAQWSDHFNLENVVSFHAIDDGILKKDYGGTYGGAFRPKFQWSTNKQG
jgi:lipopolysaccharide transport system ATP-binding protein